MSNSRVVVTINTPEDRATVARWASQTGWGTVVEFKKKTRSVEQNAKLHAMLAEVSDQVVWYGRKLSTEDWKNVFSASLRKALVVPGIDPGTVVPLGIHTSTMTVDEMSNMIELIYAFGAQPEHPVTFKDPNTPASGEVSPASTDVPDEPPAISSDQEPEGESSVPSSGSVSDPTLFGTFDYAAGELQHLKDFVRKALDDAASDRDAPAREAAIEQLRVSYREVIESDDGRTAMAAICKAFPYVIYDGRPRDKAAAYIAREILDCPVEHLEGRGNG